jgi:hypothetical protein
MKIEVFDAGEMMAYLDNLDPTLVEITSQPDDYKVCVSVDGKAVYRQGEIREEVQVSADDGEPISDAYLLTVASSREDTAWVGDGGGPGYLFKNQFGCEIFAVRFRDGGWCFYLVDGDGFDGSESALVAIKNRGQFRRLCAALGVELKEGE